MPEKDILNKRLTEWRVAPARDYAVRKAVWTRLDHADARQASRSLAGVPFGLAALASVVLLVAAGLGGRAQAQALARQDREALALHYLSSLDARSKLETSP